MTLTRHPNATLCRLVDRHYVLAWVLNLQPDRPGHFGPLPSNTQIFAATAQQTPESHERRDLRCFLLKLTHPNLPPCFLNTKKRFLTTRNARSLAGHGLRGVVAALRYFFALRGKRRGTLQLPLGDAFGNCKIMSH